MPEIDPGCLCDSADMRTAVVLKALKQGDNVERGGQGELAAGGAQVNAHVLEDC